MVAISSLTQSILGFVMHVQKNPFKFHFMRQLWWEQKLKNNEWQENSRNFPVGTGALKKF
jgi:hypothetical protein